MPPRPRDHDDDHLITTYWRRHCEYIYSVAIYEVPLASVGRWYARLASLALLGPARGQTVTVTLAVPDAYGQPRRRVRETRRGGRLGAGPDPDGATRR
jgi:hypothetical protein